MFDIRVLLVSVSQLFCFLWAALVRIFVSDTHPNTKPGDIEAGMTPIIVRDDVKSCPHTSQNDLESGISCLKCHSADFVDIPLDELLPVPGEAIDFGSPVYPTVWPRIERDEFKVNIVASEQPQEKTLTCVFKPVITTLDHLVAPCSAVVEYFDERDFSTCELDGPPAEIGRSSCAGHSVSKVDTFTPTLVIVQEETSLSSVHNSDKETAYDLVVQLEPAPGKRETAASGRRSNRKRQGLMDLIDQFPDVPRYLPPGPHALAPNPALASPPSSEKSAGGSQKSGNTSYGSTGADETPDTSAPGTPQAQTDEGFFGVSGPATLLEDNKVSNFRPRASQAQSLRWSFLERSGINSARQATARAVLMGLQSDGSDSGIDSILERLEGSSFGSSCSRPQSVTGATFNTSATPADSTTAPSHKARVVAGVEDEAVTRGILRWEESKQQALKAFREADPNDGMGPFHLA